MRRYRFRVSPQATRDLLEIWQFIARDNLTVANKVSDDLDAAIRLLGQFPGIGHTRPDVKDPRLLFYSVYSYVIAYIPNPSPLRVLRVVHGSRNFKRLFKKP